MSCSNGTQLAKDPNYRLSLDDIKHNQVLIDEYIDTIPFLERGRPLAILYDIFDVIDTEIVWDLEEQLTIAEAFGQWLLTH